MLAKSFSFLTNAALAAFILGAAIAGPHRVLCPECYGLTEIAPRIWTDAPARADGHLQLIRTARSNVSRFFKDPATTPVFILCSTRACASDFGIGGNGLSVADLIVMVAPGGLNIGTLTHELTHSRLHRSMTIRNLINHPYPTWFDEGLATHVARHPRWPGEVSDKARARVRQARHVWHWGATMKALGVGRAYGAAAAEVALIERLLGQDGLLDLIARAESGEDFDALEAELAGR